MHEQFHESPPLTLQEIRNLDIVYACAAFWTEALSRDFRSPLREEQLTGFSNNLRTEIARSLGPLTMATSSSASLRLRNGIKYPRGMDGQFEASQEALIYLRRERISLNLFLPLISMRIIDGRIEICPDDADVPGFDDWQVIYDQRQPDIEAVAAVGRLFRPQRKWQLDEAL